MAKRGKMPMDTGDFEESFDTDGDETGTQSPGVAVQRHQILTEFEERVPIQSLRPQPQDIVEPKEIAPSDASEEGEGIPVGAMQLIEKKVRFQLRVWHLPNYDLDGRTDTQARDYCGMLEYMPNFEEAIHRRWGSQGGVFYIQAYYTGKPIREGVFPLFRCKPLLVVAPALNPTTGEKTETFIPMPVYSEAAASPPPPQSLKDQLREIVEVQGLLRKLNPETPAVTQQPAPVQAPPPEDPEFAALRFIASSPEVIDKFRDGVVGKILGGGNKEDQNTWIDVAMRAVETGQAAAIVESGVKALLSGFSGLIPNFTGGQASAPPPAPSAEPPASAPPAGALVPTPVPTSEVPLPSYEEQVLGIAIDHCLKGRPATVAANRIIAIADRINDEDPAQSIDEYLLLFGKMGPEDALAIAAQLHADGAKLQTVPNAQAWIQEFQAAINRFIPPADEGEEAPTQ